MVALTLLYTAAASDDCQSSSDCLLLGSCKHGVCHCRQGFTGPECGQLDVGAVPAHLGYRNRGASTWCGLPLKIWGEWHMYVSMIRNKCPLGAVNNNSEIVHLVSSGGFSGPFAYADVVVPSFAHNAAPRLLPDGSIGVWFIGYDGPVDAISCAGDVPPEDLVWPDWSGKQIALARSPSGKPSGPWNVSFLFDRPRLPHDWWHWDCAATDPSALVAADGSVAMLYRGKVCDHCDGYPQIPPRTSERLGITTAPTVAGPYTRAAAPFYLGENAEDPFNWRGADGSHHVIAHGGPQLVFDDPPPLVGGARAQPVLLGLVNGAQLFPGTEAGFMHIPSFTLIQPVLKTDDAPAAADQRITLTRASVIDGFCAPTSGGGNLAPFALADEQALVGDPRAGAGHAPVTFWSPGYTKWYYPEVFAVLDLGATFRVTALWGYHEFGGVHVQVSLSAENAILTPSLSAEISTTASPTVRQPIKGWEKSWASMLNCSTEARYLSLRFYSEATLHELVVYGERISPPSPPQPPPAAPQQPPLMRSFLGANGFVDDPVSRLNAAGSMREYQDWVWTEGMPDAGWPHAANSFSPSYSQFDIDAEYVRLKNASIDVHQCLQGRPWFMSKEANGTVNATTKGWKPVIDAMIHNLTAIVDPASYAAIAAHAYQVAARYGTVKVAASNLQLAKGQPVRSGMDVLKHIEILNEPDGWWAGREHFMKPFEIAAMLSAAYDGHERKISGAATGVGVKNADPKMQVVMPGVTGTSKKNLDIVRMIRLWAQAARKDRLFPADVLNFHGYSTDTKAEPDSARTPEQNNMQEGLRELTAWRDANEPTLQVWLTEFGYDTSQGSTDRAVAYKSYTGDQVQAMWLVRGYMLAAAAKIDRAHIFMLRNVNDHGGQKFDTCGLTSAKSSQWKPKISWYFVSTLTSLLGHMRHSSSTLDNSTKLYVAKFEADAAERQKLTRRGVAAAKTAFVVWLGTMTDARRSYSLDVGSSSTVTLVWLVDNSTLGNQSSLAAPGGKVQLTAGEVPLLELIGSQPQPPTGPVPPIDAPTPYACKAPNGSSLPTGLHCGDGSNHPASLAPEADRRDKHRVRCEPGVAVRREKARAVLQPRAQAGERVGRCLRALPVCRDLHLPEHGAELRCGWRDRHRLLLSTYK